MNTWNNENVHLKQWKCLLSNSFDYVCRHFHPINRKTWDFFFWKIKHNNRGQPKIIFNSKGFSLKLQNFSFLNQGVSSKPSVKYIVAPIFCFLSWTSNIGYLLIFQFCLTVQSFSKIGKIDIQHFIKSWGLLRAL